MDASECLQLVSHNKFNLSRQLILNRHKRPLGSEIRILERQSGLPVSAARLSRNKRACIYSEMLTRTQLSALALEDPVRAQEHSSTRRFVYIQQRDLADPALIEKLVQGEKALRNYRQTLVVTMPALPSRNIKLKSKKAIIEHVYLMKDHGIEMALDNYSPLQETSEILTTLNLFDYIKIRCDSFEPSLKLNANPELFNQLYDLIISIKHRTRVSFIADNIEHTASHLLATALPFDYFQGSHYSDAGTV